jgi:hypothetical protein
LLPLALWLLAIGSAKAGAVDGNGAWVLASLVATVSPDIGGPKKGIMAKLIDGRSKFRFPAGETIAIEAQSIRSGLAP